MTQPCDRMRQRRFWPVHPRAGGRSSRSNNCHRQLGYRLELRSHNEPRRHCIWVYLSPMRACIAETHPDARDCAGGQHQLRAETYGGSDLPGRVSGFALMPCLRPACHACPEPYAAERAFTNPPNTSWRTPERAASFKPVARPMPSAYMRVARASGSRPKDKSIDRHPSGAAIFVPSCHRLRAAVDALVLVRSCRRQPTAARTHNQWFRRYLACGRRCQRRDHEASA